MMFRRTVVGFVSLVSLAGCASTTTNQPSTNAAQQVRVRPRRRNVQRVMGDAVRRAAECLPRAAGTITVSGEFHGDTGEFRVLNIESAAPLGTSVRTCVREEFESAHVESFGDERYAASRVFGPDGVIIAAENGNAHAQAVAASGENTVASASPPPASPAPTSTVASASPEPAASPMLPTPPVGPAHTEPVASAAPTPVEPPHNTPRPAPIAPTEAGPIPSSLAAGCYQSIARVNPTVGGRIRLRFEVTPDGSARNVTGTVLGTPTGPATLFANAMRCIEQRTRAFAFGRNDSGSVDLIVSLTPGPRGGAVSIERRTGGLTATAPGREAGEPAATPTTGTTTAANWNEISAAGAPSYNQQIADTVRNRVGDIRTCYQSQLTHSPELLLRTRVRFSIDAAGQVPAASSTTVVLAGDADSATAVAQCVEGIVRSTGFPVRTGAAPLETSLPFSFAPGTGASASNANAPTAPRNAPAATGRIDPVRTAATIRANTDQVRACYTSALRSHPDLSGRVLVRFTVDSDGRVIAPSSQVTPVSGDRDAFESVATCIESVLQSIPLPAPTGGPAAVALPFDFSPNAL